MRVLFVHDHRLKKFTDKFYTTGGLSDTVTSRYTDVFEQMTLVCRYENVKSVNGLEEIKNSRVNVEAININKVVPNSRVLSHLKKQVEVSDKIIIRLPSMLGVFAARIAKKMSKPIFVEVVGSAFGSYWYRSTFGKLVAIPLDLENKKIVKAADYVLYVSEDYLQKAYPTKGRSIGCSDVILEQQDPESLNARIERFQIKEKKEKLILGTLAQVDQKYKGHTYVFDAIKQLIDSGVDVEYRMAGSGSPARLSEYAKKLNIEEHIVFNGQIRHENVNEWIDQLDIYIQPSMTEGMPRSVIEAMYRGCPTIVSSAGGMYELAGTEYTYSKRSIKQLYKLLKRMDNEELIKMAISNFKRADRFNLTTLNQKRNQFLMMYREGKRE